MTTRILIAGLVFLGLATQLKAQLIGEPGRNDELGAALAAGDFDGDGFMDLAAGVPGEHVGTIPHGAVNVIYGSADRLDMSRQQQWTVASLGTPKEEKSVNVGQALTTGDFNGDGFDDLAMRGRGTNAFGPKGGVVYVVYGSPTGLSRLSGSQTWSFDREDICFDFNDRSRSCDDNPSGLGMDFGFALAAGDFNGNGYDQLAIGIPGLPVDAKERAGGVLILQSDPRGLIADDHQFITQDSPEGIIGGSEADDAFGRGLEAGDINADGFDDLGIGAPFEDIESLNAPFGGSVNLLYGSANGLTELGNQFFVTQPVGSADGSTESDWFGTAMAIGHYSSMAGQSPRFADLAIGAPGPGRDAGHTQIHEGSLNGVSSTSDPWSATRLGFTTDFDRSGAALASGDFNGDGYDELVVARPEHNFLRGALDILTGSADGLILPLQPRSRWGLDTLGVYPPSFCTENLCIGRPFGELEEFATALATGDFDADGYMDLAIGAPRRHLFIQDRSGVIVEPDYDILGAGSVNVVYGSPDGLDAETAEDWQQNVPPNPTEPVTPADNSALVIGGVETPGSPSTPIAIAWTESADPDSMEVTYEWQLSSTEAFDDTLGSFEAGSLNQLIVTHGEIAQVMNAAGVDLNETVNWYHRIVTHDPVAGTPGRALSIILGRGAIVSTEVDETPSSVLSLDVYPNPASGSATVSWSGAEVGDLLVAVHDVRGAVVRTAVLGASRSRSYDLNTSSLPAGVYFVSVRDDRSNVSQKLVVLP